MCVCVLSMIILGHVQGKGSVSMHTQTHMNTLYEPSKKTNKQPSRQAMAQTLQQRQPLSLQLLIYHLRVSVC